MPTRRIAGLGLLVAAGLVALLVGAYRGHWLTGRAVADWTAPPLVGSCVGVPDGDETAVVPCDEPHLQEVTRTVAATDPRRDTVSRHWDSFCGDPSSRYVGVRVAPAPPPTDASAIAWRLPAPQYAYGLLREQRAGLASGIGWIACTVRPQGWATYTGSVRGVGVTPDRPSAFATCGSGTEAPFGFSGVSCVDPHDWQVVGEWPGPSGWAVSADGELIPSGEGPDSTVLQDGCRDFAATILGAADPTYGGVLRVDVPESFGDALVPPPEAPPAGSPAGEPGPGREQALVPGAIYRCLVTPADAAMQLADGMERWGDRPPPLRPTSTG